MEFNKVYEEVDNINKDLTPRPASYDSIEEMIYKKIDHTATAEYLQPFEILDMSILLPDESKSGTIDPNNHTPKRSLLFLFNIFMERYFDGGTLIIKCDDHAKVDYNIKARHEATYILKKREPEDLEVLSPGNKPYDEENYDFDTKFVKQLTYFPDSKSWVDTTTRPFDTFGGGYKDELARKIEAKTALWKSGHEHKSNYVLQLDFNGKLVVYKRFYDRDNNCWVNLKLDRSQYEFIPTADNAKYLQKYLNALKLFIDPPEELLTWEV